MQDLFGSSKTVRKAEKSGLRVSIPLHVAMATWAGNCRLVARLPGHDGGLANRVVDLNAMEAARQSRLGEGDPEGLADALVPPCLMALLCSGPRAVQRARQSLAYGVKWFRRGDLPLECAPRLQDVQLKPCLEKLVAVRLGDGGGWALGTHELKEHPARGPGAVLSRSPQPTLAAIGMHGGRPGGYCLALEDVSGLVLGAWLNMDFQPEGRLTLQSKKQERSLPLEAWSDLALPSLEAGELMLLPAPCLKPLQGLEAGAKLRVTSPFDCLELEMDKEWVHPTVQ